MPTIKQSYIQELNLIAGRYGTLEDQTIKRMLVMLRDLRARIAAQIATAGGWEPWRLRNLRAGIEDVIAQFQAQLNAELRASFQDTLVAGGESAVKPFEAAGISGGISGVFFRPSTAQVNVMLDFSARLVKQISDEVRGKIDQAVRLSVLGEKSPFQAMKDITSELYKQPQGKIPTGKEVVGGIAGRAEKVVRTEMQRAFNLATYSQQLETAKRIPGITKGWQATADRRTRPTHLRAHIRYKDNPIPIAEKFVVGTSRMLYPLDPNGDIKEVAGCRCRPVTYHPVIGRIGSTLDARIVKELKRRAA